MQVSTLAAGPPLQGARCDVAFFSFLRWFFWALELQYL